ncbi:LysR family transcriptional regulator [Xanthobacter tagetidis]|uniref:LysR family transcriptional regulator n=1 Tax=Xanthobacter tagetidis TaxID=60216 RepID=A0A3L7AMX1_9HYPH|nr:LysR family transcriptional regulator [Xanthobacter tagetidis]MBB6308181.1 DNA-binding transcriptional LysR family regulator [Xanthobacter tagetidis]RLP81799.1 LysR family transcriptional regulator [Xanthobacter tagetidis]
MIGNLGDLEIFARIVTAGSLSAAGRELGLSPPVVSKRIQRLEERLGARLFQRTTRKVTLTEAGQGFYERVVSILASIEEAENQLARKSSEVRGLLMVAAPTSFGRLHIAPFLGPLLAANPDLVVDLELSDAFVDIVGEGFDVAVRIADLDDSSLVARRLAPVHRVLCATPDYLKKAGEPKSIADLAQHVLLATHSQDPWRLEGPDGPITLRTHSPLRTNSNEVVRAATLASIGIALRSTWDVGPELRSGALKVVLPKWRASHRVGLFAVYPSRRFLPQKVRVFIDHLAGLYGTVPPWDEGLEHLFDPRVAA